MPTLLFINGIRLRQILLPKLPHSLNMAYNLVRRILPKYILNANEDLTLIGNNNS